MIYMHVLNRGPAGVHSPADVVFGSVTSRARPVVIWAAPAA